MCHFYLQMLILEYSNTTLIQMNGSETKDIVQEMQIYSFKEW